MFPCVCRLKSLSVKNLGPKYLMHLYNSSENVVKAPKKALITNFEALQRGAKDNWTYKILPLPPWTQGVN